LIEDNDALIVQGKEVEYIFFPGESPVVSHGEFRFENRASQPKSCLITACYFVENEREIPLDEFYLYSDDFALEKEFTIPPRSSLDIRVTFPFQDVHVGVRFRYGVHITCLCDGKQYDAFSQLNLIQELPK
jgi:hypothetical protein